MLKFVYEKVSEHITRIFAFETELMYLIEGENQAILLDTGSGLGSLYGCVQEILKEHYHEDLPLSILITHGHVDHAMGANEFDECGCSVYMSYKDAYIYENHGKDAFRKQNLSLLKVGEDQGYFDEEKDYQPTMPFSKFKDLKEGDSFDLGNVEINVYACQVIH